MKQFETTFGDLADPRAGNARYTLLEVVFIARSGLCIGMEY